MATCNGRELKWFYCYLHNNFCTFRGFHQEVYFRSYRDRLLVSHLCGNETFAKKIVTGNSAVVVVKTSRKRQSSGGENNEKCLHGKGKQIDGDFVAGFD